MLSFGAFAFAAPWALVALAGLPILWWLLRVTPPAPRLLRFPAIRLLFGLRQDEQTPARTPLWLILLRMAIATLVILGLARPVLNPENQFDAPGPLMLVIDDGWAAARGWTQRTAAVEALLARAQRAEKPIIILTTAEPDSGGPLAPSKLLTAGAARSVVQALQPKPWPTARAKALEVLKGLKLEQRANVVWIADGIDEGGARDFINRLTFFGPVTVMGDAPGSGALALPPPNTASAQLKGRLLRADAGESEAFWVRGLDDRGRVLLRERIAFTAGARSAESVLSLPPELRNRLTRLEVEGVASAATVALFDERWRRRPVGIVTAATDKAQTRPLLSEIFYLERALGPYAELRKGPVASLLARRLAVLVIADGSILTPGDRETIKDWMARGGTVLRFAGPRLVQKPDELTPVALRAGNRALGGAMSWTVPAKLAPFSASSPFAGLALPTDVLVSRQVLAQPALDLPNRTWARLADGTPLITAAEKGRGRLILIHTTANTEWSNLALSGLYVELLRRVVSLSQGVSGARNQALPPVTSLDGFGRFTDPPAAAQPLPADDDEAPAATAGTKPVPIRLGPTRPPGFYGNDAARFAVNLGDNITRLTPIGALPAGVTALELAAPAETDLKAILLAVALGLLIIDLWAGLILRGLAPEFWPFLRRPGEGHVARAEESGATVASSLVIAAALLALAVAGPVHAQDQRRSAPRVTDSQAMDATFDTRLAYVLTGDSRVDEVSRTGLRGLSRTLRMRTSVEPKPPIGVDVERDELNFFPLLYWPITAAQPLPSRSAREKLARYLRSGGMIMFDTRDQGSGALGTPGGLAPSGPGAAKLRQIVSGLPVPALIPVPNTHILTKAFYLLKEFPGRWTGGHLWVEKEAGQDNDGVSSVIIGSNDFAGAWAVDDGGQPLYPVVPGGSRQRELAHRFGVNLVMYALTGNYKSDQVHVPAILERLGQ
ncbi:MAG: DUF4159 domain-containing protein [Alphaproteobacteria bacterium]|nr:DUF4159 domain-containing protein [Alphaproteobacteria bacterium]